MSIKSILFPWGHNLDLERQLAQVEYQLDRLASQNRDLQRTIEQLEAGLRIEAQAKTYARTKLRELRASLKEAHFRNPATGRLGPKGVVYNQGATSK